MNKIRVGWFRFPWLPRTQTLLMATLVAAFAGCSSTNSLNHLRPAPGVKGDYRAHIEKLYKDFNTINTFYETGQLPLLVHSNFVVKGDQLVPTDGYVNLTAATSTKEERRNRIVYDMIYLINEYYDAYEMSWYATSVGTEGVADLLSLGTSLAGATTGDAGLKAMLAAITSGFTGTKMAVQKHVLQDQSITMIIHTMRQARQDKLTDIRGKLVSGTNLTSVSVYPLQAAVVDVQEYFYAGTLLGAIQSILGKNTEKMEKMHAARIAEQTNLLSEYKKVIETYRAAVEQLNAAKQTNAAVSVRAQAAGVAAGSGSQ